MVYLYGMGEAKNPKNRGLSFEAISIGIALFMLLGLISLMFPKPNSDKSAVGIAPTAEAAIYGLPKPDSLLSKSRARSYPVLKGIKIDPKDPFKLEFIIDTEDEEEVSQEEVDKLIKYFLATLTTPEKDLWVNLSPYEQERVISDNLSLTDLGKDMLGQDYVLKQFLSSLTYPESQLGKRYWKKVYEEVYQLASTTNIPINTFNKVWIVPERAQVYEHGNLAVIAYADLKAMHEEDYLALKKNTESQIPDQTEKINKVASDVMKEIILPEIERDVNYGENFAKLRQMYHSFILATWFKEKLKDTVFQYYIDQKKTEGIDLEDKGAKEKIFNLYVEAYKKGVYNYVKSDYDPNMRETIDRQYYSGGLQWEADKVSSSAVGPEEIDKVVDEQDDMRAELRVNPLSPEQSQSSDLNLAMASSPLIGLESQEFSRQIEQLFMEILSSEEYDDEFRSNKADEISDLMQEQLEREIGIPNDLDIPHLDKVAEGYNVPLVAMDEWIRKAKEVMRKLLGPTLRKVAITPAEMIHSLNAQESTRGAWVVELPMNVEELIQLLDRIEENNLQLLVGEIDGDLTQYLFVERGGGAGTTGGRPLGDSPIHLCQLAEVRGHSHPKGTDFDSAGDEEVYAGAISEGYPRPELVLLYDGEIISLAYRRGLNYDFEIMRGDEAIEKLEEIGYLPSASSSVNPTDDEFENLNDDLRDLADKLLPLNEFEDFDNQLKELLNERAPLIRRRRVIGVEKVKEHSSLFPENAPSFFQALTFKRKHPENIFQYDFSFTVFRTTRVNLSNLFLEAIDPSTGDILFTAQAERVLDNSFNFTIFIKDDEPFVLRVKRKPSKEVARRPTDPRQISAAQIELAVFSIIAGDALLNPDEDDEATVLGSALLEEQGAGDLATWLDSQLLNLPLSADERSRTVQALVHLFERTEKNERWDPLWDIIAAALEREGFEISYPQAKEPPSRDELGGTSGEATSSSSSKANEVGGIDFDPANLNLNVKGNVFFNLPLETIRKFQTSTGMTFQILKIEKGVNLQSLLGREQEYSLSP